jgi:hypothetical protein
MRTPPNKPEAEPAPSKPVIAKPPGIASASVPDTLAALQVNPDLGLTLAEVDARRKESGYNEVAEKKGHPVLMFLGKGFDHSLVHFLLRGNEPSYGRAWSDPFSDRALSPALGWMVGQVARNEIIHLASQSHAEKGLVVGVWQIQFALLRRVNGQAVRLQRIGGGGDSPMRQGLTRPRELRATFGASHVARAWSVASRRRHR